MSKVVVASTAGGLEAALETIFSFNGGIEKLLGSHKEVWIKINAIDCRPETYTSPAVLEATIKALKEGGAGKIRVIENCTQGNFTRLVFAATELGRVCRRQGAHPLYLDEGPVEEIALPGLDSKARFPRLVIEKLGGGPQRDVFFLNLPRLKTHSMTVVTLGLKNLFGLMDQRDRMHDHNDHLHARLAAIGALFPPDLTIIDGVRAVYHGHYPPESLLDRCLADLGVLIGGTDLLAVDTVGAGILGYDLQEVEHLAIAREISGGSADPEVVDPDHVMGNFGRKYPYSMLPDMPPDVSILRGAEKCCPEGCRNNTEAVLQFLYADHNGKGGFTILMGRGFEQEILQKLEGPVLLAGKCAIEEVSELLENTSRITILFRSPACNDLASTIKALTRLMGVSPLKLVPLHPLHSLVLLTIARLKGSKARVAL